MYETSSTIGFKDQFDLAKFIPYDLTAESYDIFNSKFLYELKLLQPSGEFIVNIEENAPDLIAYRLYGNENLWWVVLWYNDISCFQEIRSGVKIKFPKYSALETLYFSLKEL